MRNVIDDLDVTDDGSPAAAASRLLCNMYPSRAVERDGTVVGCWLAVGASPRPGGGPNAMPAQVRVVGILRTADGRVVGSDGLHVRNAGLGLAVLRDLAGATCEVGSERLADAAARFVVGLRTTIRHVAAPGEDVPFPAAMSQAIEDALGWRPTEGELASACRGWRRTNSARIRRFLRTLDAEALRTALPLGGMDDLVGLAWPGLDATFEPEAPLRAAIRARPHQPRLLLQAWLADQGRVRRAVAVADVDGLVDSLVLEAKLLPPSLLPSLAAAERASGPNHSGRPGTEDPIALTRRLVGLPARSRPATDAEWEALRGLCPVLDEVRTWRGPRPMTSTLLGHTRSWQQVHRVLADAAGTTDMGMALGRLGIMSRHLAREVLMPAVAHVDGRAPDPGDDGSGNWDDAAHAMLTSGLSLRTVFRNAVGWETGRNLLARRDPLLARASWPACLPDARYHRVRLKVLTTGAEVVAAVPCPALGVVPGRLLSEAVARSRRMRLRLVAIEVGDDATGWAAGSIAAVDPSGTPPGVIAHVGSDGAAPGQDCVNALSRYVRELRRGVARFPGLAEAKATRGPPLAALCGYEWRKLGSWKAARRAWDRYLPADLRGCDVETMAATARGQVAVEGKRWSPEPVTPTLPRPVMSEEAEDEAVSGHSP